MCCFLVCQCHHSPSVPRHEGKFTVATLTTSLLMLDSGSLCTWTVLWAHTGQQEGSNGADGCQIRHQLLSQIGNRLCTCEKRSPVSPGPIHFTGHFQRRRTELWAGPQVFSSPAHPPRLSPREPELLPGAHGRHPLPHSEPAPQVQERGGHQPDR